MLLDFQDNEDIGGRMAAAATVFGRFSHPEMLVAHGGRVKTIAAGHYTVTGLSHHLRLGEFVAHQTRTGVHLGEVVRVEPDIAYVCPIEPGEPIGIGDLILRRGAFRLSPADSWCGRTINSLGAPIDGLGPLENGPHRRSISNTAPPSMTRQRITQGFKTGVRAIDIFSPLCLGQRLGIFAGSGVGKSTLLSMLARADAFDKVVIALVGERGREVREMIEDELGPEGMARSVVVVATSDEPAIMRRRAGELAVRLAEYFADAGSDVTLFFDSLTRLAMAERELGLAAGEPPTARGYTPSVFALLPALLERTGPRERGSITGLFTVLVDGDDMNDPIADSARSILDGHIVLDRRLAHQGRYPAVDPLASISRLASAISEPEDAAAATALRAMMAAVEEVRDLVEVGAYAPGSNPTADQGLLIEADIRALLGQAPDDLVHADESRERAKAIVERVR